jgi:hypothetical protein
MMTEDIPFLSEAMGMKIRGSDGETIELGEIQ